MMIVIASLAVAIVAFILYVLERRTSNQSISWEHAGKLSLFSGLITSGVVFATTTDGLSSLPNAIQTVSDNASEIQDMFVGTPSF
jgi:TRAP-type C4-dicarboxylate transport system permease small subunit